MKNYLTTVLSLWRVVLVCALFYAHDHLDALSRVTPLMSSPQQPVLQAGSGGK